MKIFTLARHDLLLMMRDRSSIFWVFLAPFLWVGLFGQMSGGGADASRIRIELALYMEEQGELASRLAELLKAENFNIKVIGPGEIASAPAPGSDEGPTRALVIPAGFERAIEAREKVELPFHVKEDASQEGSFAADLAIHRAVVRLLAGKALGKMDPADDLVKISSSWAGARKIPSGYDQTVPGYLVMFGFMSTLIYGAAGLTEERRTGTIARLGTAPVSRTQLVLGKLGGRALIATVQISIFLVMGATVFRVDWSHSPLGLAAVVISLILCASALGLLGGTLFRSAEAASGVGVVLSLVMSALGGCWWPAEIMPRWLQNASHLLPTAWAMKGLHEVVSWGGGLAEVLLPSLVLCLFATGAILLAIRRLNPAER